MTGRRVLHESTARVREAPSSSTIHVGWVSAPMDPKPSRAWWRTVRAALVGDGSASSGRRRDAVHRLAQASGIFSTIRPACIPKSKTPIFGGSTPIVVRAVHI
jgi:hypothetical protein